MDGGISLSVTTVALLLAGVALLTAVATFVLEVRDLPANRAVVTFFLSLVGIWLLACGALLLLDPAI